MCRAFFHVCIHHIRGGEIVKKSTKKGLKKRHYYPRTFTSEQKMHIFYAFYKPFIFNILQNDKISKDSKIRYFRPKTGYFSPHKAYIYDG